MASKVKLTGRCLCGAVGIIGTANEPKVAACHCDMCRRWSSGPYFEVPCVSRQGFWNQEQLKQVKSSAHLVDCIMRRVVCDASGALRASFV